MLAACRGWRSTPSVLGRARRLTKRSSAPGASLPTLRHWYGAGSDSPRGDPTPIKRAYIWDLAAAGSAVRRLLAAGASVFLLDWERTAEPFGLPEYGDGLIREALDAARIDQAVLLARSLGGLFAAVFAALHPDRVRGLGLLATPLHFAPGVGIFSEMAARCLGRRCRRRCPAPSSARRAFAPRP